MTRPAAAPGPVGEAVELARIEARVAELLLELEDLVAELAVAIAEERRQREALELRIRRGFGTILGVRVRPEGENRRRWKLH